MAWYALYKWFREFRKTLYTNMIQEYRKHLYEEWYNSLSDEDRRIYDQMKEDQERERKETLDKELAVMGRIMQTAFRHTNMEDFYGGQNAIQGLRSIVRAL